MSLQKEKIVYLRSLGCSKNTVDSEVMLALLKRKGYRTTDNPEEASRIVVNTCAFIDEAKEQAIDSILELAVHRKRGVKLIVAGCLPQLNWRELLDEMPEVDAVVGVGNLESILEAIDSAGEQRDFPDSRCIEEGYREYASRSELLSFPGFAYVKISEGCSRHCSFCLIPKIRGKMRSRLPATIIHEARSLRKRGIQELILISQDTLSYGKDLGMRDGLKTLLEGIVRESGISFLRLLYLRPSQELFQLIELFNGGGVLPYFDIPIQHVSEKILRLMGRSGGDREYRRIIDSIRERVPGAVFRTSVIVGFPGETDRDFALLLNFVQEVEFNHLGVFIFSPQRETAAFSLKGRVPRKVAEIRKRLLMESQQKISHRLLTRLVGQTFPVLVEERFQEEPLYIGRSYHFTPEVDGVFLLRSAKNLVPRSIVHARVTSADDYDLHGEALKS